MCNRQNVSQNCSLSETQKIFIYFIAQHTISTHIFWALNSIVFNLYVSINVVVEFNMHLLRLSISNHGSFLFLLSNIPNVIKQSLLLFLLPLLLEHFSSHHGLNLVRVVVFTLQSYNNQSFSFRGILKNNGMQSGS